MWLNRKEKKRKEEEIRRMAPRAARPHYKSETCRRVCLDAYWQPIRSMGSARDAWLCRYASC